MNKQTNNGAKVDFSCQVPPDLAENAGALQKWGAPLSGLFPGLFLAE